MRFLLFVLLALPGFSYADCVLKQELRGQKHFICQAPGTSKAVHVLDLQGGFQETAYFHGYFLRKEIERGVLKGVQTKTENAFGDLSPKDRDQALLIKKCVIDNYRQSVSDEFKQGIQNLYQGMKDAGSSVSWKAFEETNYMVEFSIFTEAMQRQLGEDAGKAKMKVFASCAPYFIGNALFKPFKKLATALRSLKMGCTGISASASSSMDGALVHGRNFDTGLLGFYELEQVIVINRQKNGITSVGIGSAGLHYAGGVSGFNNYGISISVHELESEGTKIRYDRGASDIAPYLAHLVITQARTLDEALALVKQRRGFGAWTFLISDAKTDEVASVEISGDTVVVARRAKNKFMGQSNHYLAPATSAEGYEYSMNKTLETRARLSWVTKELGNDFGKINYQWVINHLAGHQDDFVGLRSFGRTTTKVYTASTHVMIPARQEWWMTLGETYPTNRSHFVGFKLNPRGSASPVQIIGVTKAWEDSRIPQWYDSLYYYDQAYLNNENDHKTIAGIDKTLGHLERAIELSSQDHVYEYPYHFMWARTKVYRAALLISQGRKDLAYSDLVHAQDKFAEISQTLSGKLHEYELFQLGLWSFRVETLKPSTKQNRSLQSQFRSQAQNIVQSLIRQFPRQSELYDLQWSLGEDAQLYIVLDAPVHLETVE